MSGYSLIIPYFNEGSNINLTLEEYAKVLKNSNIEYEIIIIDDGSKKPASEYLKKNLEKLNYKLIVQNINKGYGSSIKKGIESAAYENIIITDSDYTYPAKSLERMIPIMEEDRSIAMVIGSREGKKAMIPLTRKPAKYLLRKLASYLCEVNIRDLNSGLRIFKKSIFEKYKYLMPKRFSLTSTLTILCSIEGDNVIYIPIQYRKRNGKSNISPIKDTIRFLNLILKLVLISNGMKIFFPLSIILFLLSISLLTVRLIGFDIGVSTSIILFCSGLQTLSLGAICTCINYNSRRTYV